MTPVALASIMLLLLAAAVSATAHLYRKRLPKPVLRSWRRHHGLYKAAGMASLAFIFIALYGGGQI
jgi:CBS-domain-containing membrane protein